MTHGWPGSIFKLVNVVGRLADPAARGGNADDALDLVLPSLPGYGLSGKLKNLVWGPARIARASAE